MKVTEFDFDNQSITITLDGCIRHGVIEADSDRGYIDYFVWSTGDLETRSYKHRIFGNVRIFVFES